MPKLDEAIQILRALIEKEEKSHREWEKRRLDTKVPAFVLDKYEDDYERAHKDLEEFLLLFVQQPPHHAVHFDVLEKFRADGALEKSVFIMTKFPETDPQRQSNLDKELGKVIDVVEKSISAAGYIARIARPPGYHALIWNNIELHLLGCRAAVAIAESCYKPELNPNVALEWGWMRALGKKVLFLRERGFKEMRADVQGFEYREFDWANPDATIPAIVKGWLAKGI